LRRWGIGGAKPVIGSWGRLLAKVNDRDRRAILEHKAVLGSVQAFGLLYPGIHQKARADIRAVVVGDKVITAIYRKSAH